MSVRLNFLTKEINSRQALGPDGFKLFCKEIIFLEFLLTLSSKNWYGKKRNNHWRVIVINNKRICTLPTRIGQGTVNQSFKGPIILIVALMGLYSLIGYWPYLTRLIRAFISTMSQ